MTDAIRGYWTAVPTPLTALGAVDNARLATHVRGLFAAGIDGVVLFGTTGEGTSFNVGERIATVEALLGAGIAPGRIGLGGGFAAITDSISLTRAALAAGLTQILLLPPYFYRDVDAAGIESAFAAILDAVADDRLRLTLYHIPQVAGVGVPPDVAAKLRARYGHVVAGVKDSSADFDQFRAFRAAAPQLAVTVGNEADIARAMAEGGAGTICGMANVAPALVKMMLDGPAKDTAKETAKEIAMREAIALVSGRPFVPALKAILAAQTGDSAWAQVRPPLRAVADGAALKARLDAVLRSAGL